MTDDDTTQTDDGEETMPVGNFWGWLREHKGGALHSELGEKLAELTTACIEHNGSGSLTLQIKVKSSGDDQTVFIKDDIKSNVPQADRGGSIMFVGDDGSLSRENPRQMSLPMRVVETQQGEPVVLDTNTGEVRSI